MGELWSGVADACSQEGVQLSMARVVVKDADNDGVE